MGSQSSAQAGLYQTIMAQMNQSGAFTRSIGVTITHVGPQKACGELAPAGSNANPLGTIHGGAVCTLMDAVGGAAGASSGFGYATVNCDIHYFRASAPTERLLCQAEALNIGRHIQVFDVTVTNEAGILVAEGTYTYRVLHPISNVPQN